MLHNPRRGHVIFHFTGTRGRRGGSRGERELFFCEVRYVQPKIRENIPACIQCAPSAQKIGEGLIDLNEVMTFPFSLMHDQQSIISLLTRHITLRDFRDGNSVTSSFFSHGQNGG